MAPVPKSSLAFQQANVVELDKEAKSFLLKQGSPSRPCYEKMKSCEFSVEVSSESFEEEVSPWTKRAFSNRKATEGKDLQFFQNDIATYKLVVCLQDDKLGETVPKTIGDDFCSKFGALGQVKKQSPVESDETSNSCVVSTPTTLPKYAVEFPLDTSAIEQEIKSGESQPSVSLRQLSQVVKKSNSRKRKSIDTTTQKAVIKSRSITVSAQKQPVKRQSKRKKKRNKHETIPVVDGNHKEFPEKKPPRKQTASKVVHSYKSSGSSSNHCALDSGMSSGSSYNNAGNSQGNSCSNSANGGSSRGGGGGGGFCKKGGLGGHGGDEDEKKNPFSAADVNMSNDDDEEDDDGDVKMKSKEGSGMDCNEGQETMHSVAWEDYKFQTQHLQHGAYCSSDKCERKLCPEIKREIKHIQDHNIIWELKDVQVDDGNIKCHRCYRTFLLIKLHNAGCNLRGSCRVHFCKELSCGEQRDVHQEPDQIVRSQLPLSPVPIYRTRPQDVDGYVAYSSSCVPVGTFFQENMDYIKGEDVGNGRNGYVYKAHFRTMSPFYDKPMVVKETEYPISSEEVQVYRAIGDHPNVVKHHMVTMRGNAGKASIFMDQCDKSLKDLCLEHPFDDKEAIFYWHQVVDAVKHIHECGVIHKDIKAQNVLLSGLPGTGENFRAKLSDFDAAKILINDCINGGLKPQGTPGFVSPEVLNSHSHGRPADIFGLGCLLMELKGFVPRQDQFAEQLEELGKNSPVLKQVVECCVKKEPSERPTALQIQAFLNNNVPDELQ